MSGRVPNFEIDPRSRKISQSHPKPDIWDRKLFFSELFWPKNGKVTFWAKKISDNAVLFLEWRRKKSNFTQFSNFLSLLRKIFGEIGPNFFFWRPQKTGFAASPKNFGCNDSFGRRRIFITVRWSRFVDFLISPTFLFHRLDEFDYPKE